MQNEKTSVLSNGLIWFGAAVSIAEILTGALLAPLGFTRGIAAIVLGHAIGGILMYLAGMIGAKTGKSAMDTVQISFGNKGALFFSVMNILQLVGWTAVMIIGGARATGAIANPALQTHGETLWCIVIGLMIIIWLLVGMKNLSRLNIFAMSALFLLTLVLSLVVFRNGPLASPSGSMGFGAAVELSAAMPISWLPLISDYTRFAAKPRTATGVSAVTYFITSCWMYIIGMGAAILTGQSDVAQIMMTAGLGVAGIFIIIFSTVTTTFLDAYSAGISYTSIHNKASGKWAAVIVCIIGTLLAIFTPIAQYENFLYLIGSVFAPMIAILITDYFILKKNNTNQTVNITNFITWMAGFLLYRWFLSLQTPLGSTLPVMIIVSLLCLMIQRGKKYVRKSA